LEIKRKRSSGVQKNGTRWGKEKQKEGREGGAPLSFMMICWRGKEYCAKVRLGGGGGERKEEHPGGMKGSFSSRGGWKLKSKLKFSAAPE